MAPTPAFVGDPETPLAPVTAARALAIPRAPWSGIADFGRSFRPRGLSRPAAAPATAPPPPPPPLVRNAAAPRFFSASRSASASAERRVASATRFAAALAAARGSNALAPPPPLVLSEAFCSFAFCSFGGGGPTGVTPSAAKRVARRASLGRSEDSSFPLFSAVDDFASSRSSLTR